MNGAYVDTDSGFPSPVLRARFRNPHSQTNSIERRCILDTGMSACGLPQSVIEKDLKLKYRTLGLTSYTKNADGEITKRRAWMVLVELLDFESRRLEKTCGKVKVVGLADKAHPIVGRDVLNQFVVTLNGPELVCEIA